MQKPSVQIWLNDACCKKINVVPGTSFEDIIRLIASQQQFSKRTLSHLEVHVFVDGKDHSVVPKGEKILAHTQSLAQKGINLDDPKNKYVLVVNAASIQKAQKHAPESAEGAPSSSAGSGSSASYFALLKKRIGHQRSISLPTAASTKAAAAAPATPEALKVLIANTTDTSSKRTKSPNHSPNHSPSHSPSHSPNHSPRASTPTVVIPARASDESLLDAEKMPSSTPTATPQLAPRVSISPPRATFRARSKTISQSLSSSDLRSQDQEAINHIITQKIRNRSSLGFDHPPLGGSADLQRMDTPQLLIDEAYPVADLDQNSSRLFGSNNRAGSPPPPHRLYGLPPTIASHSHTRQRSLTTSSTVTSTRSSTPPKTTLRASLESATGQWLKHDSKKANEYSELLGVVDQLKKAT